MKTPPPPDPAQGAQPEERRTAISQALAELRAEYAAELPERLTELTALLERAKRDPEDAGLRREVWTAAHRLHGTAGSYGFTSISDAARRIGLALDAAGAGRLAPDAAWAEIDSALAEIRARAAEEGA